MEFNIGELALILGTASIITIIFTVFSDSVKPLIIITKFLSLLFILIGNYMVAYKIISNKHEVNKE